jgi:hypothetical protein
MALVPSDLQLDLFRTVEDIHDLTNAIVVLLVDADGKSIAVSGDEDEIPGPVRAVLGRRALAAAGSVRELLTPVAGDLGSSLNLTIFEVGSGHLLAIAFDVNADLGTVEVVGREARDAIASLLSTS